MNTGNLEVTRFRAHKPKTEWSDNNSSFGDYLPCAYCGKPIDLYFDMIGSRHEYDRSNRIDCQEGSEITSYHLDCYDLEVFGEVSPKTIIRMERWKIAHQGKPHES